MQTNLKKLELNQETVRSLTFNQLEVTDAGAVGVFLTRPPICEMTNFKTCRGA